MIPFNYKQISRDFIQELSEKVIDGESVVLLGPRYSGKRYVINRLHTYLQEKGVFPVVQIKLLRETPVATEWEAHEIISQAVNSIDENLYLNEQPVDGLFGPIDQLSSRTQKPVVLLAANIDGMAHHLARRFLEGVRTRVESGKLIAVLSGESDFRDLVHGPKSEFNCANQFVLQGFANDEFNTFVCQYTSALNVEFEDPAEMCHILWERIGGNTYLMRLLLWTVFESRVRSNVSQSIPIKVSDITNSIETMGIPGVYGAHILRYTTYVIAREPECWSDLERLIFDEPVKIVYNAPTSLELAGVAIREDNQLRFASPLMAKFIRQHYDNRRLGDLYARNYQWDRAFEHYTHVEPEETIRPLNVDDRLSVELTVKALITSLHSAATKGVHDVKRLFSQGCRYVLGFHEVTFWQFDKVWQFQSLDNSTTSKDVIDKVVKILPSSMVSPGLLPVPEPWNSYAIAAILPALRSDQQCAVVISDFERRTIISRERERLAKNLLEHFVEIYIHAFSVERDQARLSIRNQHVEIVDSILEALGSRVLNVGHVLAMANRGLRNLGYKRVLFCLVDPTGKKIQCVPSDDDRLSKKIGDMTDWLLDDPMADLQSYVIYTKKPKIVEDASQEPLANKKVVELAQMKAEAIVPILNPAGDAIGTIHVEREDDTVPSPEEVEDLVALGRQLAIAIEQSERVNLMGATLDKIPEPVVIVDQLERVRYANKPAAELFDVQIGWRDRSEAKPFPGKEIGQILQYLQESLTSGRRIVHHFKGIGNEPDYRGAVLCDNIQDWRETTIGALLHIQDLNYLYRVFKAFQLIAMANDTSSAMRSVLDAAELLGHKWGRLYLIDEDDLNRLVSKLSFDTGFGFKDLEVKNKFDTGQLYLRSLRK